MKTVKLDLPIDGDPKVSILMVQGTAPMYYDGKIPGCPPDYYLGNRALYQELVHELVGYKYRTVRYLRDGVSQSGINWDKYIHVDHYQIIKQLNLIKNSLPESEPKILFCWSGGSLHVSHLDLTDVNGIVIVGGLCTNRFHNAGLKTKSKEQLKGFMAEVASFAALTSSEIDRINEPNRDGPLKRFWQELHLLDNWRYIESHIEIPMLIMHGDEDEEVDVKQGRLWNQLLPKHNIKYIEVAGGDHFLNTEHTNGAKRIGFEINQWLIENNLTSR